MRTPGDEPPLFLAGALLLLGAPLLLGTLLLLLLPWPQAPPQVPPRGPLPLPSEGPSEGPHNMLYSRREPKSLSSGSGGGGSLSGYRLQEGRVGTQEAGNLVDQENGWHGR